MVASSPRSSASEARSACAEPTALSQTPTERVFFCDLPREEQQSFLEETKAELESISLASPVELCLLFLPWFFVLFAAAFIHSSKLFDTSSSAFLVKLLRWSIWLSMGGGVLVISLNQVATILARDVINALQFWCNHDYDTEPGVEARRAANGQE